MQNRKPIFLTGGGTLGPVTPLLAVYEAWKEVDPSQTFVWIGTPRGPEARLVREAGILFHALWVPKFYRYLTWRWLLVPIASFVAFFGSLFLLARYRPSWIVSAGGFTSVPIALLAPLFGTKVAIHQLDASILLANRLMTPVASLITVTWPGTERLFSGKKVEVVGTVVASSRAHGGSREYAGEVFHIDSTRPTVLVVGGGGGSMAINRLMEAIADRLVIDVNVLHATGRGKAIFVGRRPPEGYVVTELFTETYPLALSFADVVVTRAGMGQIAELVETKKPAVMIPLPHSGQEANARAVKEAGAGIVLHEEETSPEDLLGAIQKALDPAVASTLGRRMGELLPQGRGARRIVELIKGISAKVDEITVRGQDSR